ncbi:MAG: hypothetical protein ACJ749_02735 [Flavisolibacter sp.]
MKNLFTAILICLSFFCSAQKINGFYSGTLYNDSTKMTQRYELALNEYRGKIYGYSYVTFVKNDTFYYGIRKIKANIVGDSLIVEDDKMVVNNFPEAPAKRVGRTITIPLNGQDSLVDISGTWKTNQTKKYYSVPGVIKMNKSTDSSGSPLIAHLKELNIIASENTVNQSGVAQTSVTPPPVIETRPIENTVAETKAPEKKVKEKKIKEKKVIEPDATETTAETIKRKEEKNEVKVKTEAVTAPPAKPVVVKLPYDQRKNKMMQTVNASSDSLLLSFYDNGVVDGDSISVYLNGQPVLTNERLKSTATRKMIYVGNLDEMNLLLVAENLGTLPPNTGLLMIKDGEASYQINFSADMQTNALIVIRRKK